MNWKMKMNIPITSRVSRPKISRSPDPPGGNGGKTNSRSSIPSSGSTQALPTYSHPSTFRLSCTFISLESLLPVPLSFTMYGTLKIRKLAMLAAQTSINCSILLHSGYLFTYTHKRISHRSPNCPSSYPRLKNP